LSDSLPHRILLREPHGAIIEPLCSARRTGLSGCPTGDERRKWPEAGNPIAMLN